MPYLLDKQCPSIDTILNLTLWVKFFILIRERYTCKKNQTEIYLYVYQAHKGVKPVLAQKLVKMEYYSHPEWTPLQAQAKALRLVAAQFVLCCMASKCLPTICLQFAIKKKAIAGAATGTEEEEIEEVMFKKWSDLFVQAISCCYVRQEKAGKVWAENCWNFFCFQI